MTSSNNYFFPKLETETGLVIRGRHFSSQELKLISQIVQENCEHGRTRASIKICRALKWNQPNGLPKDRACRDVLLALEQRGYIVLPPRKNASKRNIQAKKRNFDHALDKTSVKHIDFSSIKFEQVKGTKKEQLWNWIVDNFHYLGFTVFVGRSLKYLIYTEERILGAIGWCDPAWHLAARDNLLNDLGFELEEIRLRGINNGRFLILPWVRVQNLASHLLSLANKELQRDWVQYYNVSPLFLETFVDPTKFSGTCYKAANWFLLGRSRGYRKCGQVYKNNQKPKYMFIYPLETDLRIRIIERMF